MPVGTLDQHQDSNSSAFGFGQYANARSRGQCFTPSVTGTLGTIGFDRNKGSYGLRVFIDTTSSHKPAHNEAGALYYFDIPNASVINGYGTYDLPVPPLLTAGTEYCFYLEPWDVGGTNAYVDDYQDCHGINSGTVEITNTNGSWANENLTFHYATYMVVLSAPTVTTSAADTIASTSANGYGNVTSDGGATITERGFCWGTSANPTTANNKLAVAGTTGVYSGAMTGLLANTLYHYRAYAINSQGTSYGADTQFTTLSASPNSFTIQKKYYYKIYDTNYKYITTWSSDVISDPTFRTVINGGPGELIVSLARKFDNFGENVDVGLNFRVELWAADADNIANNANDNTLWDNAKWDVDLWDSAIHSYIKIFSGYISAYAPTIDGDEQWVDVTVLGFITDATYRIVRDSSGNDTLTYTGQDPSAILQDLINKYRADGGTALNYQGNSIKSTNTTVTYKFVHMTLKECMDKVLELCPYDWYYFVDNNGIVYLQEMNLATPNHTLTIGKNIFYSQTTKRIENVVNEVSVVGGGNPNLFNLYQRASSVTNYGKKHRKVQDGNVTDNATADKLAKAILDRFQVPETRSVIRVFDNNGEDSNSGANIEGFQIGDTIQVKNLNYGAQGVTIWDQAKWDVDVWDYTINFTSASILTIVSLIYYPEYIEIEASSRLPEITKDLQVINRQLNTLFQQNLPTAPTVRSV